jgi:hypothetical protein
MPLPAEASLGDVGECQDLWPLPCESESGALLACHDDAASLLAAAIADRERPSLSAVDRSLVAPMWPSSVGHMADRRLVLHEQGPARPEGDWCLLPIRFACLPGLTRFDGHRSSGVRPRKDVRYGEHGEEAPAARHARLQDTRRTRRTGQDKEGGLTESSALSVKAGQPDGENDDDSHVTATAPARPGRRMTPAVVTKCLDVWPGSWRISRVVTAGRGRWKAAGLVGCRRRDWDGCRSGRPARRRGYLRSASVPTAPPHR